jgi:protein ImuB
MGGKEIQDHRDKNGDKETGRTEGRMNRRFVSIWFRHLAIDWFSRQQPEINKQPFVLRTPSRGRMIITGVNDLAAKAGIRNGMVLADARAVVPNLRYLDDKPDLPSRLLKKLAEWCIRFTPCVATNEPDGLLLDVTGCSHLWGGDQNYINEITKKLNARGYSVRVSIADTIGAAWAVARYGKELVVESNRHVDALLSLPPECLRIEFDVIERLHKLGLHSISRFMNMPRSSLRKRFGALFLERIDQAMGHVGQVGHAGRQEEIIEPIQPIEPYMERLPCMEPIVTATGIGIALEQLLNTLCQRLQQEQKGLRTAVFKCYRLDGKMVQISIATNRPSCSVKHLFKLFDLKISSIEPDLGIELFVLEAPVIEDHIPQQEKFWEGTAGLENIKLSELVDRLTGRVGAHAIHRYLPDEHYWPERSFKPARSLIEKPTTAWRDDKIRPLQVLSTPERIEVTAPIPDYPPMSFNYRSNLHTIVKADGPERIEQEWWLQQGEHRDYYRVEDEKGCRYWIFRLGHYKEETFQWFLHGYFV